MCEYSNKATAWRNGAKGDRLVVTSINKGCVGFADAKSRNTAVCLTHGTELAFSNPISYCDETGFHQTQQMVAKFVELYPAERQTRWSDALLIEGEPQPVLLIYLSLYLNATVLQLPMARLDGAEQLRAHDILSMQEDELEHSGL